MADDARNGPKKTSVIHTGEYTVAVHSDAFNADFYVTVATVIPVLYLALTLQGQTFESLVVQHKRLHDVPLRERDLGWTSKDFILFTAAYLIPIGAIIGEGIAIFDIYRETAYGSDLIIGSIAILLAAVAAVPLLSFLGRVVKVTGEGTGNQGSVAGELDPAGDQAADKRQLGQSVPDDADDQSDSETV